MDEIDSAYPVTVVSIAIVTGLVIVLTFRLILYITAKVVGAINRLLPHRVAIVLSLIVVGYALVSLTTGVLLKSALHGLDNTFAALDRVLDDQYEPPEDDLASGSTRSLIKWDDIGSNGKRFVLYGPRLADITTLLGREASHPDLRRVQHGRQPEEARPDRAGRVETGRWFRALPAHYRGTHRHGLARPSRSGYGGVPARW